MAEPIATIKQGQLRGVTDTDLNGATYYKFLGIPYAKPPLGPLRFKAPQQVESWTGIQDATVAGNPSLSVDIMTYLKEGPSSSKTTGSEDCLYLNVYTKELPKAGLRPKPVMVNIHGGAFTIGNGSEEMGGSKYLVAQDIVLVSINYRLGVLGFLSSDDVSLNVPGNAGLKDQTFALKWVQENISAFNGDPNNVTIFGISAGGASVHFQVLSPSAKGLFHKGIAQSGSALSTWAWGQKNMIQIAEILGTKVFNDKDALDVLMNVSAAELYQASLKIPDVLLDASKRRPFGPVIEKPNATAFLTENPTDLLLSGKFNQVPLILGCTSNEGLMSEFKSPLTPSVNPEEIAAIWSLGLEGNKGKQSEIKAKINNFYFKNGPTNEAAQEIFGDVCFMLGVIQAAKLAIAKSQQSLYLYVFSYEIALSNIMLKAFGLTADNLKGVVHGGESGFLFSNDLYQTLDAKSAKEALVGIKYVTKMWTDFAKTGRPHELWEPVTDVDELKYFEIAQDSKLKVNPFAERVSIWESVLGKVPGIDARRQENALSTV